MITKALSNFAIPKVASETKTKLSSAPANIAVVRRAKRATILPRAISASKLRSGVRSLVPYFSVTAIAMIVFLFGFHLFMVNAYVTKGMELKKAQQAVRDLDTKQKTLLVEQSELGSITKVNDVANIYGLVPVTNEEFLNSTQLSQK